MKQALLILLAGLLPHAVMARPVDLSPPGDRANPASPEGYLALYRDLATVDFGNGVQLPLRLDFSSERKGTSPYVGAFWRCVLLEAIAIPLREDLIDVCLLCGKHLYLYRSKEDPNRYWDRKREWQGEMKQGVLRVFRDDGWELTYIKGRISALKTDTGRVLNWVWNGKVVAAIREGPGTPALEVKFDSANGQPKALVVNRREHTLSFADQRLQSVAWPSGEKETYAISVAESGLSRLVLKDRQNEEKSYTWNTTTGHIVSDSDGWTYQVEEVKRPEYERPAMSRTNKEGQTESYHFDASKGMSVSQALDGTITKQYFFKSLGPLYMKLRKMEETKDGKTAVTYRAAFDEAGKLIRETKNQDGKDVTTTYQYDAAGNQAMALQGDKVLWKKEYDSQRHLISELRTNGDRVQRKYLAENSYEQITLPPDGWKQIDLFEKGELRQRTFPDGKSDRYQYDRDTGALKERVDSEGTVWRYTYDPVTGQVSEVQRNGQPWSRWFFDQKKKRNLTIHYNTDGTIAGAVETTTWIPIDDEDLKSLIASKDFSSLSRP